MTGRDRLDAAVDASAARGPGPLPEIVMSDPRQALADRVRAVLPRYGSVREVSMFGGVSFMLDNRMVVSVDRDGGLLVRVDPSRSDELLSAPAARPAVMGADRPMGPGWLTVTADGLTTEQQLTKWIGVALQHHSTQARGRR